MIKHEVIDQAIKEQKRLKHPYVGTEHLLLSLLLTTPTKEILEDNELTYDIFNDKLIQLVGIGTTKPNQTQYTPLLQHIVDESIQLAKHNKRKLSSEHFLYSLLEDSEGVAARILEDLDIDLDQVYNDTCKIIATPKKNLLKENTCLTDLNKETLHDKTIVTGLDNELTQLIKNLLRIKKPNTIIIGEPGVGKTALVEKLAIAINNKEVPSIISDYHIIQLSLGSAIAGTKYRGEFEQKISDILKEVEKDPNIILFVDEFHNMIGAGGAEGAIDASNLFKPALARGKIKMIGATTKDEYNNYLVKDKAFLRRFNIIEMLETTKEETIKIMKDQIPKLESHYNIKIKDKDLLEIYNISTHKSGRMPDIALDALEEWCVDKYYDEIIKKDKANKSSSDKSNNDNELVSQS